MINERTFFDIFERELPSSSVRQAYSKWLLDNGEQSKAGFVRHRAEMMRLAGGTQMYQFHAGAAAEFRATIEDEDWLERFRTDLTLHERASLHCVPLWTGAGPLNGDLPTLDIADGLSIYFHASSIGQAITRKLLRQWKMPFEYIVSNTVILWEDDLQCWSRMDCEEFDRVYLHEDTGDDGCWAMWFYARPETWSELENATDGEVALSGPPVLMPLDANRILLTSCNDQRGLRQLANAASAMLTHGEPIICRPLRYHPKKNWDFLADEENEAADDWQALFGPNKHSPLTQRNLQQPIEVIDPQEREAAQHLVHRYPISNRLERLSLSGQQGDWRKGERQIATTVPCLSSLPHLRELRIWSAELPKPWWTALADCELPNLVSILLDRCHYDGSAVGTLARFPSIECLHLSQLTDDGLQAAENLSRLQELNVSNTAISDHGLESLRNSPLRSLDLSNCQLTDHAAQSIRTLAHLTHLSLQNTAITDCAIEKLEGLENLVYLDLRGTAVTDDVIFSLSQMRMLRKIDGISSSALVTLVDELPHFGTRPSR